MPKDQVGKNTCMLTNRKKVFPGWTND